VRDPIRDLLGLQHIGPEYKTPQEKEGRLASLQAMAAKNQELFNQAAATVTDPAQLEVLRQQYQLDPETIAEMERLASETGHYIGESLQVKVDPKVVENARANALRLMQTQAQATIAGMKNPFAINRVEGNLIAKQLENAKLISDPGERDQAVAEALAAQAQNRRQRSDLQEQKAMARLQLQGAVVAGDPIAAAKNQVDQAQLAVQQAGDNETAMLQAQAQLVQAHQALKEAFGGLAHAQSELIKAQMTASGDLLGAAQEGVRDAERALNDARAQKKGPEIIAQLETDVVNAKDAARKQDIDDRTTAIDFDLEMGLITKEAAMARYRALMVLMNPREQREMTLKLHQMEKDAAGAGQFNLPTTLGLPTLYTARRITQETGQMGTGAAPGTRQLSQTNYDNRIITVSLNANGNFDGQQAVDTIVAALNEAPRYGLQPKTY
jgi:hypothetical protein